MFSTGQMRLYLLLSLLVIGSHVYGREVDNKKAKKCKEEYSCASCNEVRICAKTRYGWKEQLLFSCNPTTPYCDYATGTCTSEPSLECAPTDSFICMRDGTFPDPSSCTQYHVCFNYTSFHYKCDSYYYYNSNKEKCDYQSGCYTFDCSGKSGAKIAYENDASIFAYCVNSSAYIVDRCPANYELSSSKQTCLPKCNFERVTPDVDDCTKYYKCTKESHSTYILSHEVCPYGDGFDPVYGNCVSLSMLPDCKKPYT